MAPSPPSPPPPPSPSSPQAASSALGAPPRRPVPSATPPPSSPATGSSWAARGGASPLAAPRPTKCSTSRGTSLPTRCATGEWSGVVEKERPKKVSTDTRVHRSVVRLVDQRPDLLQPKKKTGSCCSRSLPSVFSMKVRPSPTPKGSNQAHHPVLTVAKLPSARTSPTRHTLSPPHHLLPALRIHSAT